MKFATTPELARLVANIRPPANYFSGIPPLKMAIPENILLFTRMQTGELGSERVSHHRFVLVMNFSGAGRVILDHRIFDFHEGNCLLFFPFQFHHYIIDERSSIQWVFLTFELPGYEHLAMLKDCSLNIDAEGLSILESIIRKYPVRHSHLFRNNELILLTAQLLNHLAGSGHKRESFHDGSNRDSALLDKIHAFVGENLGSRLDTRSVARHVAVSESHLRLRYRAATGISLGVYIRELRARKAMALLSNSVLNISEIGYACGYESVSAFIRSFRKRLGVSPREYRRKLTKES